LQPHLLYFWTVVRARLDRRQQAGRLKQWLNFLRRKHPKAQDAFTSLRTVQDPSSVDAWFALQAQQAGYAAVSAAPAALAA
jgi:tRNA-dihydrouridine synthase C